MQVLDNEEYQRRKQYYTEQGNRHWYFMRLDGGETVDAARKVRTPTASSQIAGCCYHPCPVKVLALRHNG